MKVATRTASVLVVAFLALSIPGPAPDAGEPPASGATFAWNQDSLWLALESRYAKQRAADCAMLSDSIDVEIREIVQEAAQLTDTVRAHDDPIFDSLETGFFDLAPVVAACPHHTPALVEAYRRIRESTKWQSKN